MTGLSVGVDVGGTKIAAGRVGESGSLVDRVEVPTPRDPDAIVTAIGEVVTELVGRGECRSVGLAVAGFVAQDRRTVQFAANLGWRDLDVATRIERVGLRVVVENDANAAAWAEYVVGAGRDSADMLMVTVGTGIGGGFIIGGDLVRGAHGDAAEIGHITFERDGLPCRCGRRGCWEQYASGTALVRRTRLAAQSDPAASALIEHAGGEVDAIQGAMVTDLAVAGDAFSLRMLQDLGRDLGEGIASMCSVLDPDLVVVGGGVATAGDILLTPLREVLAASITGGGSRPIPRVVAAALGNDAGIVGAALLS